MTKRFTSMYNEQTDMIQYVDTLKEEPNKWSICNVSETLQKLNELHEEVEYLKPLSNENTHYLADMEEDIISFKQKIEKLENENEQLKQELKEFKDFVYSDEKILCYSCVNCLSKGIYQIECSEKGKVDVHGSCLAYWKKEVE